LWLWSSVDLDEEAMGFNRIIEIATYKMEYEEA
jgi:hypothetical protein